MECAPIVRAHQHVRNAAAATAAGDLARAGQEHELAADAFYDAIQHSPDNIDDSVVDQWLKVQRMLKNLSLLTRGSQEPINLELLQRTMSSMDDGGASIARLLVEAAADLESQIIWFFSSLPRTLAPSCARLRVQG